MSAETEVLTTEHVESVFVSCLFKGGEARRGCVVAEGIVQTVWFHPGRIEEHRQEIYDMLAELPNEFRQSGGGGMSFLNACMDRHGNQWTGLHQVMDHLVTLGIATEQVEFLVPRSQWKAMRGGMPYFVVKQ